MARGTMVSVSLTLIIEAILLGVFLFVVFFLLKLYWNPSQQTTFTSVQEMALAIDEVCGKDNGTSKTISINMAQLTPPTPLGATVFPLIYMRVNGDPRYLLYYENFPPGEGVTWEIYNNLPARAVVLANPRPGETFGEYLSRFRQELGTAQFSTDVTKYAFGNIMLGDYSSDKNEPHLAGDIGSWDGYFYKFEKIPYLANAEQSLVKYRPCGAYSLCFKMGEGILRIPLEKCERAGIKTMQVERRPPKHYGNDAEAYIKTVSTGAAAGAAVGAVFGGIGALPGTILGGSVGIIVQRVYDLTATEKYKSQVSDFYLASPCKAKITIEKTDCACKNEVELDWRDAIKTIIPTPRGMTDITIKFLENLFTKEYSSQEFSVFSAGGDSFSARKSKNICVHQHSTEMNERELNQECVKITLDDINGFCTGGQNELGQVTLSTAWAENAGAGMAILGDTKKLRELVTTGEEAGFIQKKIFGSLRVPFGWPIG